jgi:hypothetical protein
VKAVSKGAVKANVPVAVSPVVGAKDAMALAKKKNSVSMA